MEIYDVMRTTFAGREYTGEELSTGVIYRILDMARFAPTMLTPESTRSALDSAKRVIDTLEQRLVKRS